MSVTERMRMLTALRNVKRWGTALGPEDVENELPDDFVSDERLWRDGLATWGEGDTMRLTEEGEALLKKGSRE